jgi:hypothetical protein
MTESSTGIEGLSLLSTEVLQADIVSAMERIAEVGFSPEDAPSLVDGTRYRARFWVEERVCAFEDANGWLPIDERRVMINKLHDEYDGLSGDNLAETFRYQYDRATKEHGLKRRGFPAVGSPTYTTILGEMVSIGSRVRVLRERFPDQSMFTYLPVKTDGQWRVQGVEVKTS